MLVKTDFDEGTNFNTIGILKELKKFMKSSNFVIDGSIPSEWYVDSLLEYLKKIPKEYQNNDFDKLFREIESNINGSIKELDFESLSVCLGKVKFVKRGKINYENKKKVIIDIDLNEKVQKIIEKEPIQVELSFKYNDSIKLLKIEKNYKRDKLNFLDNMIFEDENKKSTLCPTIKIFVQKFPNLIKFQQIKDISIFEMDKEINLCQKLSTYFDIIKEYLIKNLQLTNQKEFQEIHDKIYDYVMVKLYDKIFFTEPDKKNNSIFTKCVLLSWTEPKHFIKGNNNYVYDSFLPDVIKYFKEIENQKSPRQKLIYMNKIFMSISNVVKFNGGKSDTGVDDQMPILNYAFIKAKPTNMYTNCRYMELFIGERKHKVDGSQLTQLMGICEHVEKINFNQLFDVPEDVFVKKCSSILSRTDSIDFSG